jgi:hypothetical protein
MKKLGIFLSIIFLLFIGSTVYVVSNFKTIVIHLTENLLEKDMGVKVTIKDVGLDSETREVYAKGVQIGNPKGFTYPYSMIIGTIRLSTDKVRVQRNIDRHHKLYISDAEFVSENFQGKNNQVVLKAMDKSKQSKVKRILTNFELKDSRILYVEEGKVKKAHNIKEVKLQDIGENQGLSSDELVDTLVNEVKSRTIDSQPQSN